MLKIIGAGFGRTGTLSMKYALERLGFSRCYHMLEVVKNPAHVALWNDATEQGTTDWEALFQGYQATVDWPAATFWRALVAAYPEARVILTKRNSEGWYRSVHNTIYQSMIDALPQLRRPSEDKATRQERLDMTRNLILEKTFAGRFEDKNFAISVFEKHNEAVIKEVPPERLLVYTPGDGWEPLCVFLDQPVPDEDYPKLNSTEDFLGQTSTFKKAGEHTK